MVNGHFVISNNTVQSFNERGTTVNKLVLPPVVKAVSEHFNCSSANGLELENQGGSGTAMSHPDQRVVMNDYMAGLSLGSLGFPSAFSNMTLSIFEASGK